MANSNLTTQADMLKLKILTIAVTVLSIVYAPTVYFVWDISQTLTKLEVQAVSSMRDTDRLVMITEKLVESLHLTREELISFSRIDLVSQTRHDSQAVVISELERRIDRLEKSRP